MNRNIMPLLLVILAIGIYFTFTRGKLAELQDIREVNAQYAEALSNSEELVKVRDKVSEAYNKIEESDKERLEKMLPDNVDNVRLIIDVNGVAARHGLAIKNVKTTAASSNTTNPNSPTNAAATTPTVGGLQIAPVTENKYNSVTLSFGISSSYQNFVDFIADLERSLRLMDITKIGVVANDTGIYDYTVELNTYWLKK